MQKRKAALWRAREDLQACRAPTAVLIWSNKEGRKGRDISHLIGEDQIWDHPDASLPSMKTTSSTPLDVSMGKYVSKNLQAFLLTHNYHPSGQFGLFLKSLMFPYHGNNVSTTRNSDDDESASCTISNL